MGSLSLRAGTLRPQNFHLEEVAYGEFLWKQFRNGVLQPGFPSSRGNRSWDMTTDIYRGFDLKDFHKRKSAGELLPQTEYTKVTSSLTTTGSFQSTQISGGVTWLNTYYSADGKNQKYLNAVNSTGYPFDFPILSPALSWIENRGINLYHYPQLASSVLYSRGWDVGTFLAEFHKVVSMIRRIIPKLANLFLEFWDLYSRGNFAKNKAPLSILQGWLEGRYGWRVLMYDLQDASEAIGRLEGVSKTRHGQHMGQDFSWTDDLSTFNSFGSSDQTYSDHRSVELNCRGTIFADFAPSNFILNPIVTAWELIPYSFVIDWILGVGTALNAFSTILITDKYTASTSFQMNVRRQGDLTVAWKPTWSGTGVQTVDHQYEIVMRNPCLVSITPQFQNLLDVPKVIDLVALIGVVLLPILYKLKIRNVS